MADQWRGTGCTISMFQYFLKVVSTQFEFLDGRELKTHQYSVTQYERDCKFYLSSILMKN